MFSFCDGDSAGGNRCALYACQKSKNQKTIQIIVHFWLTNKIDLQNIWTKKHILLSLNQSAKSVTSWPFHEKRFKPNYRTWCHRHLCISSQMHMISAQERGILWKYQYLVQKCWYAAETLLQSLPRVIPSPPLALIHMIFISAYHKTLLLQKVCHKTYHWQRGFICKYAWYFNKFQLWLGSLTF